jgi:hypothetical protein
MHRGSQAKYQATPEPHHVAINSTGLAVLGKVGKSLGSWGLLLEEADQKAHEEDYDHETLVNPSHLEGPLPACFGFGPFSWLTGIGGAQNFKPSRHVCTG